jgi:hypothetical protein
VQKLRAVRDIITILSLSKSICYACQVQRLETQALVPACELGCHRCSPAVPAMQELERVALYTVAYPPLPSGVVSGSRAVAGSVAAWPAAIASTKLRRVSCGISCTPVNCTNTQPRYPHATEKRMTDHNWQFSAGKQNRCQLQYSKLPLSGVPSTTSSATR